VVRPTRSLATIILIEQTMFHRDGLALGFVPVRKSLQQESYKIWGFSGGTLERECRLLLFVARSKMACSPRRKSVAASVEGSAII
jgi:hypothetical protein